jgi:hypothetical protein
MLEVARGWIPIVMLLLVPFIYSSLYSVTAEAVRLVSTFNLR